MSETLVYPQHPNFEPYRALAETTEILIAYDALKDLNPSPMDRSRPIRLRYQHVAVPDNPAFGHDASMMVPTGKGEKFWNENGGINTLAHDKLWPNGYVNEGHRILANEAGQNYDQPQANEVLAFGVGVLRPFRVEGKGLSSFLCETVQRVDSRQLRRLGAYIVDMNSGWNGSGWTGGSSHALESTNLVMPETLGELQQLRERKDESAFMDAYLRDLRETTAFRPTFDGDIAPHCLNSVKPLWRAAHLAHISSGIWNEAPADVSELNDRVEELLERIAVDTDPIEFTKTPEPSPDLLALMARHARD